MADEAERRSGSCFAQTCSANGLLTDPPSTLAGKALIEYSGGNSEMQQMPDPALRSLKMMMTFAWSLEKTQYGRSFGNAL
jgi:hypothetical protein